MDSHDKPTLHDVEDAIDEAKKAEQHLHEVAPGAISDPTADPDPDPGSVPNPEAGTEPGPGQGPRDTDLSERPPSGD